MPRHHGVGRLVTVAAAITIACATLLPSSDPTPAFRYYCVACGELGGVDVVLNATLFLPVGIGLALGGARPTVAISAVAAATTSIELLQLFIPGRDPNLGDVLANSIGGTLGFLVGAHGDVLLHPPRLVNRVLLAVWSVAWLAIMTASAYAFRPALTHSRYHGQIARDLGQLLQGFPGKVRNPQIDTLLIPDWEVSDQAVRGLLLQGDGATIRATVIPEACPEKTAGILRIGDAARREILLMGQDGADLIFGVRTGAQVMRLRPMYHALADVFGDSDCHVREFPIRVEAKYSHSRILLRANVDHQVLLTSSTYASLLHGWRLFTPRQTYIRAGFSAQVIGALWLTFLTLPLGYLTGSNRVASRLPERLYILVVLVCGLLVIPSLLGVATLDGLVCGASTAGVLGGSIARRYAEREGDYVAKSDDR